MNTLSDTPTADRGDWPGPSSEFASRFQILEELGGNRAWHVCLAAARGCGAPDKLLVLKQPRKESFTRKEQKEQFVAEARLSARITHPNIVRTYEVIEDPEISCVVMEYLDGQPLSEVVAKCRSELTLSMHLRIIADALVGIHYVHEFGDSDGRSAGLLHRALGPQNVFVTYEGQVKVLDFGIAKGLTKGKIHYMAPEQIVDIQLDRRADVYSVGVMLWEAIAQQKMWKDVSDEDILRSVLLADIPSVRSARADVPDELEVICSKALSPEREERYATAAELLAALEAAMQKLHLQASNHEIAQRLTATFAERRAERRNLVGRLAEPDASRPPETGSEMTKAGPAADQPMSGEPGEALRDAKVDSVPGRDGPPPCEAQRAQTPIPPPSEAQSAQTPIPPPSEAQSAQTPIPPPSEAQSAQTPIPPPSEGQSAQGPLDAQSAGTASETGRETLVPCSGPRNAPPRPGPRSGPPRPGPRTAPPRPRPRTPGAPMGGIATAPDPLLQAESVGSGAPPPAKSSDKADEATANPSGGTASAQAVTASEALSETSGKAPAQTTAAEVAPETSGKTSQQARVGETPREPLAAAAPETTSADAPASTRAQATPADAPASTRAQATPADAPASTQAQATPADAPASTQTQARPADAPASTQTQARPADAPASTQAQATPADASEDAAAKASAAESVGEAPGKLQPPGTTSGDGSEEPKAEAWESQSPSGAAPAENAVVGRGEAPSDAPAPLDSQLAEIRSVAPVTAHAFGSLDAKWPVPSFKPMIGDSPRARILWPALVAAALVGLLGLRPSRRPKPEPRPLSNAAAVATPPETQASSARTADPSHRAVANEEPPPKAVQVRLTAEPKEATLYWDGEALPSNPFENRIEIGDNPVHTVRAVAKGYEPTQTSVVLKTNVDLELSLNRSHGAGSTPASSPAATAPPRRAAAATLPAHPAAATPPAHPAAATPPAHPAAATPPARPKPSVSSGKKPSKSRYVEEP